MPRVMDPTLDKLLSAVEVSPQPFSVCRIQSRWRMSYPVFAMITVHFVLRGHGQLQVGEKSPQDFAPSSVMIVPARQKHWVGDASPSAFVVAAGEQCSLVGDGLVEFTAGHGDGDILLLCAAVPAPHLAALGLFELPHGPAVEDHAASGVPSYIFDAMRQEIARAGLGTQAMCQALMKQALISLLRARWSQAGDSALPIGAFRYPRLARAVVAVLEDPAANHSVDSLAELAGMSRASFCDHFSRGVRSGTDRLRAEDAAARGGAPAGGFRPSHEGDRPECRLRRITPVLTRLRSDLRRAAHRVSGSNDTTALPSSPSDDSVKVSDRPD